MNKKLFGTEPTLSTETSTRVQQLADQHHQYLVDEAKYYIERVEAYCLSDSPDKSFMPVQLAHRFVHHAYHVGKQYWSGKQYDECTMLFTSITEHFTRMASSFKD